MMHHVPQPGLAVPAVAGPVERVVRPHSCRADATATDSRSHCQKRHHGRRRPFAFSVAVGFGGEPNSSSTLSLVKNSGTGCSNDKTCSPRTRARSVLPGQPYIAVRSGVVSTSSAPSMGEVACNSTIDPAGSAQPSAQGSNQRYNDVPEGTWRVRI
jgi:hypothetical protein